MTLNDGMRRNTTTWGNFKSQVTLEKFGKVVIVAPAPPPITGQSSYYLYLSKILAEGEVEFVPLHTRDWRAGWRGYYNKLRIGILSATRLMYPRRWRSALVVVDAGFGLLIDAFIIAILRIKHAKIYISHHTFKYIRQKSLLMRILIAACGRGATHIFLCECMEQMFLEKYDVNNTHCLNNARRVSLSDSVGDCANIPPRFTLGYISNVSFEKGIADFIDTVKLVNEGGGNIQGIIAGPPASEKVEAYLHEKIADMPDSLIWLGAVYGEDKTEFFKSIAVMIFPTRYDVEAQPNIIFEAMSFGIPIISTNIGCIAEDLRGSGSIAIDTAIDFPKVAADEVGHLMEIFYNGAWLDVANAARNRYVLLRDVALRQEDNLIAQLYSPT